MQQDEYRSIIRHMGLFKDSQKSNLMIKIGYNNEIYPMDSVEFQEKFVCVMGSRYIPVSRIDELAVYEAGE